MAQIDWRYAVILLKDGYSGPGGTPLVNNAATDTTGAVNNASNYMAGDTTMLVDAITGAVVTGTKFTVVGDTPQHTITSHTETLGATTSITFTPALAAGVSDDAVITFLGGYAAGIATMVVDGFVGAAVTNDLFTVAGDTTRHKITSHSETLSNTTSITFTPALATAVVDNAAITMLPHEYTVKLGEGNLTWTEKRNMTYTLDRGTLNTVKQGDDVPVEVKLDALWEFLKASSGGTPTLSDVLLKRGGASAWVTSSADTCEPYAVDIEVTYTPPCSGEEKEIILLSDFRWEQRDNDLRQGGLSISGKCNITQPTITRST